MLENLLDKHFLAVSTFLPKKSTSLYHSGKVSQVEEIVGLCWSREQTMNCRFVHIQCGIYHA